MFMYSQITSLLFNGVPPVCEGSLSSEIVMNICLIYYVVMSKPKVIPRDHTATEMLFSMDG